MDLPASSFEKYYAMALFGLKNELYYKMDFLIFLVTRLASSLIMVAIWAAVYASSHSATILGYRAPEIYAYFFLVSAITSVGWPETGDNMVQDIQGGMITSYLARPLSYPVHLLFETAPDLFFTALFLSLPLSLIAVYYWSIPLTVQSVLVFFVGLCMAVALTNAIGFVIGILALKMTNLYGVLNLAFAMLMFFGGGIVPLNMLPSWSAPIVSALPFQAVLYTPVSVLIGTMSVQAAVSNMAVGLAWLAAIFVASMAMWKAARGNISTAGG